MPRQHYSIRNKTMLQRLNMTWLFLRPVLGNLSTHWNEYGPVQKQERDGDPYSFKYVLKFPNTGWQPVLVYVLKFPKSWSNIGESYGICYIMNNLAIVDNFVITKYHQVWLCEKCRRQLIYPPTGCLNSICTKKTGHQKYTFMSMHS